ncbi:MAG: serine/threonine protein kinase [Alphaproteobacteria bacterium]|jgi:serine/threonine protein kinase|nr:serine/threonine protein kinase [Alphaproteobacteria bacterium]
MNVTTHSGKVLSLGQEIGRGGFGVVYLATDANGAVFAVKLIGPVATEDDRKAFHRELENFRVIDNENVLKILDFGHCDMNGNIYLFTVAEFCAQGDFRKRIASYEAGNLDIALILNDFDEILGGLAAMHSVMVHRDLKPENILIKDNRLKIADLGLSKLVNQATASLTFKGSGSPRYMAPEVWDYQRASPATDLYAIGIMLFEVFTGGPPFKAADILKLRDEHRFIPAPRVRKVNPLVPEWIDGVVKRLLDKEPTRRYSSAEELRSALKKEAEKLPSNINAILNNVREHVDLAEQRNLEAQKKKDEVKNDLARISYKELEVVDMFSDIVSRLNDNLAESRVDFKRGPNGCRCVFGRRQLLVSFFRQGELFKDSRHQGLVERLRQRHLVHGGIIEIQENGEDREGWNIALVRGPEEIYGRWLLIETRASGLSSISTRYEPVATEAELFAKNLAHHWGRAMHVWNLKEKDLDEDDAVAIFEKFIGKPV